MKLRPRMWTDKRLGQAQMWRISQRVDLSGGVMFSALRDFAEWSAVLVTSGIIVFDFVTVLYLLVAPVLR